uniref:AlNc14C95G5832 protein n=1 Tax=Albugo laibachii Nc14 TaxID=890382 RepID=F0WGV6_9STRA|nr:AlNc14C95G5832 [Albugo laibachii Nc14]|eukprot:CCA20471.1 AlNc14C95G5832 [Albugo laibachii Nc14]
MHANNLFEAVHHCTFICEKSLDTCEPFKVQFFLILFVALSFKTYCIKANTILHRCGSIDPTTLEENTLERIIHAGSETWLISTRATKILARSRRIDKPSHTKHVALN